MSQLPPPGEDARAHSAALSTLIHAEIAASGGWISFARFMEMALYTPGLGYYSGGSRKFGPEGDFITAPELSPLFGQSVARQVAEVMAQSAPHVIEVGAGTGALAADMLLALEALGTPPVRYDIVELSGELRARQRETIAMRAPHLASRVQWLDALPDTFAGCLVANEVLDVIPVHQMVWRADGIFERGVAAEGDALVHADRPARGAVLAQAEALELPLPTNGEYVSEICPAACAWTAAWAQRLSAGALLLIDYGYPRDEYYLPSRAQGTVQCYYRHRAHTDLLRWPGLNDITAFVDFTAIAEAAFEAGLDVIGYITQGAFLANCGLLDVLAERGQTEEAMREPDYVRAARAAHRLTGPHEMGELFKVLAVGRGLSHPLRGFALGDRLHAL
ncbi:MAG: SAM-dependent methyltransferase [Rhodocyclaceae bacterium]